MAVSRRRFLERSIQGGFGVAAGVYGLPAGARAVAASDKVVVGVMGVGGRGTFLTTEFASRPDVEIAYICDVDSRKFREAVKVVEEKKGKAPQTIGDFRRILDDKNVDAMVCATPDHWHGLATVMACRAGKDIYVEKPASHNIWEGRKMVEAARKHNRVVQVGMQNRSSTYGGSARDLIQAGKIGRVHLVRVYNMLNRKPVDDPDSAPPSELDWNMWVGPGPLRPYNLKYAQRVCWDFNGGMMTDDGVHQMDLTRRVLGLAYPKSVHHTGGKLHFTDLGETPDTTIATYEYDGLTLVFEQTVWTSYMQKEPDSIRESMTQFPDWYPFNATRIEIYGDSGMMILGRQGGGWQLFDENRRMIATDKQRHSEIQAAHVENFIHCIRSRERPNADIEHGHISAALCHMANISYRLGNRKLEFDASTESFVNNPEANQLLKRVYRDPWVVPENV